MTTTALPDPTTEICITTLHATRGINFWSRRPVIRMDLSVGEYENISSAEVKDFAERLLAVMPGIVEHHCSIGSRGGFVTRLRRGTYAPHIIEHVALELQSMIGHEVGYGRTRGGDAPGEYTVVFEHEHEQVGMRAAALALDVVQRAFAGTLESVEAGVTELEVLAKTVDSSPIQQRVLCGVTGGSGRAEAQLDLVDRLKALGREEPLVIDVSPAFLLQAGVPYRSSEMAIILDTKVDDVPARYQEEDHARRLVGIVADSVRRDGIVVCPAKEWELQDAARDLDCRVAIFATDDDVTRRDQKSAFAVGRVRNDAIVVERCGDPTTLGKLRDDVPVASQVAAALAAYALMHCGD
jgi:hypothetical protein